MKPRPSQETITTGMFEHDEQLIVAGMGAGKTYAALAALSELHDADVIDCAIVLAPPLVASTVWPKEPAKWPALRREVAATAARTSPVKRLEDLRDLPKHSSVQLPVLCMSFYLCKWLEDHAAMIPPRCALVVDETSFFKDARGKNGKALRAIADRFVARYGLTGTPRPNGYLDLWGPYQMLTDSKLWPPFDDWRRRNFMSMDFNGYNWEVHDFRAREIDRQVAPLTTVVDVDLELEPLNAGPAYDFEIELPPKARAAYDEMEDELITKVVADLRKTFDGEVPEDELVAALSQAVASGKLAQIAQGYLYSRDEDEEVGKAVAQLHTAKRDALRELMLSCAGENVLIWYGYREDIRLIEEVVGTGCPRLGGGTSAAKGRKWIEAFGRGELPVLMAHPASAAHGIDELKHSCRRMIWFCPTWSAEQYEQALKRLHRPGQTRPVFSHQIVAKATVDEVKVNRVAYKLTDQAEWSRLIERTQEELKK